MDKNKTLELVVSLIGKINNTVSGPCDDDTSTCCLYASEEHQLIEMIETFKEFGVEIKYEIVEEFTDGNRDECLVIKAV